MKTFALAAGFAVLLGGTALAQTTAPAGETTQPVTGSTADGATAPETLGVEGGSPIVTLPEVQAGAAPAHFLAEDLDGEDVYGANNEEIGEVEDIVLAADGTVAAIVIEVGGFLGIGEKDVLVDWNAVEIVTEGDDVRVMAPTLTREMLEEAEGVDLDTLLVGHD
ncbi:PRC-barrel domain-containing protein [Aureimonas mangrovi]|uniref:PRC-barrel domain-containing protein n=1 Tax=Aureimonas mangrovi TaxID=2758041 RepID=UPI00163D4971|nr:PRC-barrel domain-containing protein [Aureimonas mangrovi]